MMNEDYEEAGLSVDLSEVGADLASVTSEIEAAFRQTGNVIAQELKIAAKSGGGFQRDGTKRRRGACGLSAGAGFCVRRSSFGTGRSADGERLHAANIDRIQQCKRSRISKCDRVSRRAGSYERKPVLMSSFHDVRLPLAFSLGAAGGPNWRTDIVQLASGREYRNAPWSASRRRWDIGGAVKSLEDLAELTAFFEARRGRLHGFRLRDASDHSSAPVNAEPGVADQLLGLGDGETTEFQLVKRALSGGVEQLRRITRPVAGTVRISIDGVEQETGWSVDETTGIAAFAVAPPAGAVIAAGFEFDMPVRFDTDQLGVSLDVVGAGRIVSAPVVELLE